MTCSKRLIPHHATRHTKGGQAWNSQHVTRNSNFLSAMSFSPSSPLLAMFTPWNCEAKVPKRTYFTGVYPACRSEAEIPTLGTPLNSSGLFHWGTLWVFNRGEIHVSDSAAYLIGVLPAPGQRSWRCAKLKPDEAILTYFGVFRVK